MAEAIVIDKIIKDVDVVIGLNLIEHLNGVFFDKGIVNQVRRNVHEDVQLGVAPKQTDTKSIEVSQQNLMVTNVDGGMVLK